MKTSTNFSDRNHIRDMMAKGFDPHVISQHTQIELDVVSEVMSRFETKKDPKRVAAGLKAAETRAAREAAE